MDRGGSQNSNATSCSTACRENMSRFKQCLDKCNFCSNRGNLETCSCGCVAYCSSEHQKFDWKKHKPICKVVLSKLSDAAADTNAERLPLYISNAASYSGVIQHTDVNPPSKSCGSVVTPQAGRIEPTPSTSASSPKTELSPPSSVASSIPTVDSPASCAGIGPGETLIETDDPDIQIIEGPPGAQGTPHRSRKRAIYPRTLKDHSQNMAYSISPEEHRHFLVEQGRTFNQHQSAELRLNYISQHIHRSITEYGWAVVDNFLGPDHCWHIQKEMRVLESRGLFGAGQVANDGKYKDEHHVKDIRSDKTYWFSGTDEKSSDACTVRMLITYLDSIVHKFSRRLQGNTIQGRSRAMLAIYPGNGSRYVKHVDNPAKDGRLITVIYYCNPDWDFHKDGGVLRLYPETSATPLDIEPRADRVIAFWSDHRVPHEVLPVKKDRLAITVWYMDRQERDNHIRRTDGKQPGAVGPAGILDSRRHPSVSEPKQPKELRMDKTEKAMAATQLEDSNDRDDADSGKGASMYNNNGSSIATSFRSRRTSQDSPHLTDDDDDRLPQADDLKPEYNI